jgi:hypothetical protein
VPLLNHSNEGIAYAFLDRTFSSFGVLVEIFINQGTKFHAKFYELCEKTSIDHRTISQDHLEVNG